MDRTSDKLAIMQTIYQFTHAQDRLDLATMATFLIPDQIIEFDLSKHFPEVGMLKGNATEICNILYEASAGWTATQHIVNNPVITFRSSDTSSKATIIAMVQAYHCLETDGQVDSLTVRAFWHVEMEKVNGRWVITRMAMERDIPISNLVLFEKMKARMDRGNKRKPIGNLTV